MRNGNNLPTDINADIRKRLQFVADKHSQAEMARACDTSRANISRYLSGNRIPAAVCSSLSKEFGINPAWLLTGEGEPYLSDINAGHAEMAGDLLEVVEAMNAVAQMRLGALTGKQHLKTLRDLDDALRRYESLRDKLNEHSRPILKQLVEDWDKAWHAHHPARMRQLRRAAEQVARLCDDDELNFRLLEIQAMDDLAGGDRAGALEAQRRVAQRAIMRKPVWDLDTLTAVARVTYLLEGAGNADESIAMCRAAQELARVYGAPPAHLAVLDAHIGDVLTETGRIDQGLPLIQRAMSFLPDDQKLKWKGPWAYAQFFAGALDFDQLAVDPGMTGNQLYGEQLLRIAIWMEDPEAMRTAAAIIATLRGDATDEPPAEHIVARWAIEAPEHPTAETLKQAMAEFQRIIDDYRDEPHSLFQMVAYQAQLAWLCRQEQQALKYLDEAADVRAKIPEGKKPMLIAPAVFHRQSIRQLQNAKEPRHRRLYEEATSWFRELYQRGYGRFRDLGAD